MSLALIPGSFDPMTLGHLALVEQVLREYDEAVVAVMVNPQKTTLLDMETRVEIARKTVAHLPNVRVISDTGMLIDLFDRIGADAVCKGYRNEIDYDYEMKMAEWNKAHNPRFHTVLYRSEGALATLSSTEVRRRLSTGESLDGLVSPTALRLLTEKAREGAV
jgi:pantetheine-phosphate adenylyltransferase